MSKPILWIVIPCYNEEQVLPITAPMFLEKISGLAAPVSYTHLLDAIEPLIRRHLYGGLRRMGTQLYAEKYRPYFTGI